MPLVDGVAINHFRLFEYSKVLEPLDKEPHHVGDYAFPAEPKRSIQ